MPPHSSGPTFSPLRTVTHLLSTTPTNQLPNAIFHLTSALQDCRDELSGTQHAAYTDGTDPSVLLHKYRTQLSTLLQDRTVEGRWVAVVLVKVTVEVGRWEMLRTCEGWVRALLSILDKRDPPTTKNLCIMTLTKIYLLTHQYQTLIREITTPTLPNFIHSCLGLVSSSCLLAQSPVMLDSIISAFIELLPDHRTVFRAYALQLRTLLVRLVAPTLSDKIHPKEGDVVEGFGIPAETTSSAQRLLVLLHFCAAKNGSSAEWKVGLLNAVAATHSTADRVFRAVSEDWEPADDVPRPQPSMTDHEHTVGTHDSDMIGLGPWRGINAGMDRLNGQLGVLQQYLATPTASPVSVPVGQIVHLLIRLLSTVVPANLTSTQHRLNPHIGRDEREALWAGLPRIHVAAMSTLATLLDRLESASVAVAQELLDQVIWISETEAWSADIRTISRTLVAKILCRVGPSLDKKSVSSLSRVIERCCQDLFPVSPSTAATPPNTHKPTKSGKKPNGIAPATNPDSFLPVLKASSSGASSYPSSSLHIATSALLPVLLSKLPPQHLSFSLRSLLDRDAVLTANKAAMLASVLQPAVRQGETRVTSSILPHLARLYGGDLAIEGLIRPRMPVIKGIVEDDPDSHIDHQQEAAVDGEGEMDIYRTVHDHDITINESVDPEGGVVSQSETFGDRASSLDDLHRSHSESDTAVFEAATMLPSATTSQPTAEIITTSKRAQDTLETSDVPPYSEPSKRSRLSPNAGTSSVFMASGRTGTSMEIGDSLVADAESIITGPRTSASHGTTSSVVDVAPTTSTLPSALPAPIADGKQEAKAGTTRSIYVEHDDDDEEPFEIPELVLGTDSEEMEDEAHEDEKDSNA